MAMSMADFTAYMDKNVTKDLKNLQHSLNQIDDAVKGNSARLDRQEATIKQNQTGLSELREEIRVMKSNAPDPRPTGPAQQTFDPEHRGLSTQNCQAYDRARRSLRRWPIFGIATKDMWTSTGSFLKQNLGLEDRITEDMIEGISHVQLPSGPGVNKEALVVFKEAVHRDLVMGASAKLAHFKDNEGRPTAGIRMEVPGFLLQDFRTLFKYGQTLRSRHGLGTRRHVKFEDSTRSLYLNVHLPGDDSWSRVSLELARRSLRSRELATNDDLEKRLDINGAHVDKQRSASVGEGPSRSAWTGMRTGSVSSS